jgi:hypothetical protein
MSLTAKAVILGEPASPYHQINPVELVRYLEALDIKASLTGDLYFEDTLANLNAIVSPAVGDTGFVMYDSTPSNNGVYRRESGGWTKTSELPAGFDSALLGKTGFVVLQQTYLPGDLPQNFTGTLTGSFGDASVVPGVVTNTSIGAVLRLTGEALVATRERIRLDDSKRLNVSWKFRRVTNPTDPAGDAVRIGIAWLDGNKNLLSGGKQVIETITLTTSMGTLDRQRYVIVDGSGGTAIAPPVGAVYMVPYFETFGLDGVTDLIELGFDTISVVAQTFYVTADGLDSNTGTSLSSPLATIGKALELMAAQAPASCVTIVHPGDYLVKPDTVVPTNCALYGYDLRVTKIRLSNAAGDAAAVGTARRNNIFQMTSGIKVRGFTFTGLEHEPFTLAAPPEKGWAFVFKPGEIITRSPYIADCSMLHDFTQDQMTLPIDKANGNPLMPIGAGNILADGSVLDTDSPLRSVVVDSFTAINPNGVGYAIKRNAFVQLVSVFTNWSRVGLWAHDGGQVTVANSNNTFGDYAFASTGFRNAIQIEGVSDPSVLGVYTASADIIVAQTEAIVTNLMNVRYPTITGWSGLTADQLVLTERDTRTLLRFLVNDLKSGQDRGAQYFTKGLFNWNAEYVFATSILQLFLDSWEQVRLELLARLTDANAEAMITALIGLISEVVASPASYRIPFPSVVEATGQQFSNAGSGVNYNSLPFSQRGTGSSPDPSTAILKENGGKVYATFSTEVGDTYLGEDLRIDFERSTIEGQAFSRGVQNIALPLIIGIGG